MSVLDINSSDFVRQLSANYTIAQLFSFLVDTFNLCGWGTPVAQNNTTRRAVWEVNFNPSASQGAVRIVLEVDTNNVSTARVRLRLHTVANYNISNFSFTSNTGANVANGMTTLLTYGSSLTAYVVPRPLELSGIALVQNAVVFNAFYGVCYPSEWEAWWDEDAWCRVMLVDSSLPLSFWHCYPNPQSVSASTVIRARALIDTFSGRNPVNNEVYILPAPFITSHTWGLSGRMPLNMGISNNNDLVPNDVTIVIPDEEEWWNLSCSDNGFVIRCV